LNALGRNVSRKMGHSHGKKRKEYLDRLMEERGVLRILCVQSNMVITIRVRILS
jgi:hypothetical protein